MCWIERQQASICCPRTGMETQGEQSKRGMRRTSTQPQRERKEEKGTTDLTVTDAQRRDPGSGTPRSTPPPSRFGWPPNSEAQQQPAQQTPQQTDLEKLGGAGGDDSAPGAAPRDAERSGGAAA